VPLVDVQGEVLVLAEVAVVARQRLAAVRRVVGGIDIQDHLDRRLRAGTDEEIDEVVVDDLQPLALGGADFQQDVALFRG